MGGKEVLISRIAKWFVSIMKNKSSRVRGIVCHHLVAAARVRAATARGERTCLGGRQHRWRQRRARRRLSFRRSSSSLNVGGGGGSSV